MLCVDDQYLFESKVLDLKVRAFSGYLRTVGSPMILDIDFVRKIFNITSKKSVPAYLREILSDEGVSVRVVHSGDKVKFDLILKEENEGDE
jgi:hypothetical protein